MNTTEIAEMIEKAAEAAGSQRKLAAMLDMTAPTLIQMKQGKRPANWRVRGKLRVILGEDPARAFVAAMAEDLEQSENQDEKKAADGFKTMLAAFPDGWRKRMKSLAPGALEVVVWLRGAIHGTFGGRLGHPEFQT